MAEDSEKSTGSPLISITDVLGVSAPATALVDGICKGIGVLGAVWLQSYQDKKRQKSFEDWKALVGNRSTSISHVEVDIDERTTVRIAADAKRYQRNREGVAAAAIEQFKADPTSETASSQPSAEIEFDWLDRFWRLAESASSEKMQELWAKVLVRRSKDQIGRSPRILEFISLLSPEEITAIEAIAPFLISGTSSQQRYAQCLPTSVHKAGVYSEEAHKIFSEEFPRIVGHAHADLLGPIGFYIESGWAYDFIPDFKDGICDLEIARLKFRLETSSKSTNGTIFSGHGLSPLGIELMRLVEVAPNFAFVSVLTRAWQSVGYNLVQL